VPIERAHFYKVTGGISKLTVTIEADKHRQTVRFSQPAEGGTENVSFNLDQLLDVMKVLEEIRQDMVVEPHTGIRD